MRYQRAKTIKVEALCYTIKLFFYQCGETIDMSFKIS